MILFIFDVIKILVRLLIFIFVFEVVRILFNLIDEDI